MNICWGCILLSIGGCAVKRFVCHFFIDRCAVKRFVCGEWTGQGTETYLVFIRANVASDDGVLDWHRVGGVVIEMEIHGQV